MELEFLKTRSLIDFFEESMSSLMVSSDILLNTHPRLLPDEGTTALILKDSNRRPGIFLLSYS